jgi:hypothetical protein
MSDLPKTIGDTEVAKWHDAAFTAKCLGTTTRTLRNWEAIGLPWGKCGRTRVYPFPHAFAWAVVFHWRGSKLTSLLPVDVALAQYNLHNIEEDARLRGELK